MKMMLVADAIQTTYARSAPSLRRHVFVTSRRLAEAFVASVSLPSQCEKHEICVVQGVACANA